MEFVDLLYKSKITLEVCSLMPATASHHWWCLEQQHNFWCDITLTYYGKNFTSDGISPPHRWLAEINRLKECCGSSAVRFKVCLRCAWSWIITEKTNVLRFCSICPIMDRKLQDPLLFSVFSNDLPHAVKKVCASMFADDTTLYTHAPTVNEITATLNKELRIALERVNKTYWGPRASYLLKITLWTPDCSWIWCCTM